MLIAFLIWIVCAIVSAVFLKEKNRSGCAGFFIGFVLGPIGVIIALLAEDESKNKDKLLDCPACGNEVSKQAEFCPDCGQPLNESGESEPEGDEKSECKSCRTRYNQNLKWCPECGSEYTVKNPK